MSARQPARRERGSITAEFALALPALVLVLAACCNVLGALAVRVSLAESSFIAARLLARGEQPAERGDVTRTGGFVCVEHSRTVGVLPVRARSCVLDERGSASVLVLGMSAALVSLILALAMLGGAQLRSVELALAADAAALAAASAASGLVPGLPCDWAERSSRLWNVELDACQCDTRGTCWVHTRADFVGEHLFGRARAGAE